LYVFNLKKTSEKSLQLEDLFNILE